MPKKSQDEWGTAPKTLEVLQEVNHRVIHPKYLHILWKSGRIERRAIDGRTFEYNLTQAKQLHITQKSGSGRKKVNNEILSNEI